jgi:uncharacterized protein YqjF (DUF2071 family)
MTLPPAGAGGGIAEKRPGWAAGSHTSRPFRHRVHDRTVDAAPAWSRPVRTSDTGVVTPPPPPPPPVPHEPVTADAPVRIRRPLLTQSWLDVTFLHWDADPADVEGVLPPGTFPDTLNGVTYVGLVAFRVHRAGWFRLPAVPYLGSFPETNVRLYTVDTHGRRGVVFCSLDASRLVPVVLGRAGFGMPYMWSRMAIRTGDETVTYLSSRRWPGPRGARSRITVRVGEHISRPTELEHFLTARWGLHSTLFDRPLYLPNTHPRWPLHRAGLVTCEQDLLAAAGLPQPAGEPVSILYSPGVPARFARAARPSGIPAPRLPYGASRPSFGSHHRFRRRHR